MRAPSPRGTPITPARVRRWLTDFTGYRITVNEGRIDRYLDQFRPSDRDLAARTLDAVDYLGPEKIAAAFRGGLASLPGWSTDSGRRQGQWRFAPYSSSAGESGDAMLTRFRHANNLTGAVFRSLFLHRSELMAANLGQDDTVVFVDDFAGSGKQVVDAWPAFEELLPGSPRCFLLLVAITSDAKATIERETGLTVLGDVQLHHDANLFSAHCSHFTDEEKNRILRYCRRADARKPKGFGDCGLTVVFSHGCPNNSIPILHRSHNGWDGLFRRYD